MKKQFKRAVIMLLIASSCVIMLISVWPFPSRGDLVAQAQLKEIHERIELTSTKSDVLEILEGIDNLKCKIYKINAESWLLSTPPMLGAVNWQLWIEFENELVHSVRIRLADSKAMQPKDAPQDKLTVPPN